ncbi:hypothetical protein JW935_05660 [candidate division KSB1 bacterium]|nr:hypothetical protein [candidate division KSB1 bacterium]
MPDIADSSSLCSNNVYCIFEDSKGEIWFGTEHGLEKRKVDLSGFQHYLKGSTIFTIFEDRQNNFWLGTSQNGLVLLDRDTGIMTNFGANIVGHHVRGICQDDNGKLWLSSGSGLYRFDPEDKTFTAFAKEHGLPTYFCNTSLFVPDNPSVFSVVKIQRSLLMIGTPEP